MSRLVSCSNRLLPALLACALVLAASQARAVAWTDLGTVTNSSNPSIWELKSLDVAALLPDAGAAELSFGLRNDWNSPGLTVSRVEFGIEGTRYFARFSYVTGDDTSHWRDVRLVVDGLLYVDQFGDYNDHLGDPLLGTLMQGGAGDPGVYALRPAVPVPEPGTLVLLGLGLSGLGLLSRGRGRRPAAAAPGARR